jgi:methionine-rich copper-binding protein CopC
MQNRLRIAGALSVVAVALTLSALASAHAELQKTEPANGAVLSAPPAHVQLWFDETPDTTVSKIDLLGPSGKVDLGPTHSMAAKTLMADIKGKMGDGKYTVNWQAAADDGHVSKGAFSFTLKLAH